ncbi:MAG: site-specific integrase [Clostridiales bacterium]|nr:site-specific integrase [Clostridiales bacterium]
MASIVKRKSKYAVVYFYDDEQGEKRQKWETWGTLKEAKKRKAQIELKQASGTFVRPSLKTVSDLLYDFVELYGVSKWALSTFDGKKALIDNYINPIIGDVKLSDLTPRMMDNYYLKLQKVKRASRTGEGTEDEYISTRNIIEIHKVLNCAFNQAVRWECLENNPASRATLPHYEKKTRDIWTADELFHALEVCDDDRLTLAIHLAFSCSLRLGEIVGLTWDCVDIEEESILANNASLYVNKELTRASKVALEKLDNKDVLKVFPAVFSSNSTALVLKKPKTKSSVRRVWLPVTVARMLADWKEEQEEMKEILGGEYYDYNLVIALPNGRPLEGQVLSRSFSSLIRANDLPNVVFHSLRHTSTTYKLKLNKGDMKAVQGDTGHAQLKMVSDVYSHILDEDRRNNAAKFEEAFYQGASDPALLTPKQSQPTTLEPTTEKLVEMLQSTPELAAQLLKMLSGLNSSTSAAVS